MSHLFVSAWLGSGNAGDELIFSALARALRSRGHRLTVASLAPDETTRLHGVDALPHTDLAAVAGAIRRCDGLVLGGGGLLQDDTSLLSPPYQLHRPGFARWAGRPIAGVGLGVGGLRPSSRTLVRRVLAAAEPLVVRDELSLRRLHRIGLGQARLGADLVFSLPAPEPDPEDSVAVVLRPTYPRGGLRPGRSRVAETDDGGRLDALAASIDRVARTHGLSVRLVAMEPHRDTPYLHDLGARLAADTTVIEPGLDALASIGAARVVIASRYHGVVSGIHTGRPVVALGYAGKVEALAAQTGPGVELVSHDAAGAAEVPDRVDRLLALGSSVLDEARARLRRGATDALDALAGFPG